MSKMNDVAEFYRKMGFAKRASANVTKKRIDMLQEETGELCQELETDSKVGILHEGVDSLYVTYGALLESGFSQEELDHAWELVHAANMAKDAPKDPNKKAVKPKGWKKADVSKAIGVTGSPESVLISFVQMKSPGEKVFANQVFTYTGPLNERVIRIIDGTLGEDTVILNAVRLSDA